MATVNLTPDTASQGGVAVTETTMAVADNYFVRNSGKLILYFRKTGAGAATITFVTPQTPSGLALADQTVNVPASTGSVAVVLKNRRAFNDASDDVEFTTDDDTGLSVRVIDQ